MTTIMGTTMMKIKMWMSCGQSDPGGGADSRQRDRDACPFATIGSLLTTPSWWWSSCWWWWSSSSSSSWPSWRSGGVWSHETFQLWPDLLSQLCPFIFIIFMIIKIIMIIKICFVFCCLRLTMLTVDNDGDGKYVESDVCFDEIVARGRPWKPITAFRFIEAYHWTHTSDMPCLLARSMLIIFCWLPSGQYLHFSHPTQRSTRISF